nr:hypothetical protein [Halomonas sp. A3H3]
MKATLLALVTNIVVSTAMNNRMRLAFYTGAIQFSFKQLPEFNVVASGVGNGVTAHATVNCDHYSRAACERQGGGLVKRRAGDV